MISLTSCGDLFTNKVIKRGIDTDQFSANCDLDVNQFKYILHTNIKSQILCLGENLNLFIRVVKTTRPGYMQRAALVAYINNNMPEVQPEYITALKAVYDLNYLITGDDPEYISKSNVDKIIKFTVDFNAEAALNFQPIFQDENDVSYTVHKSRRKRIKAACAKIVNELGKILNETTIPGKPRKLNIINLLNSFSTASTAPHIKKVEKILFIKSLLLGGDRYEITQGELKHLLTNFEKLAVIVLDVVNFKHIKLVQQEIYEMVQLDVESLLTVIYPVGIDRDDEVFFNLEEAREAFSTYVTIKDFDIKQYKNLIYEAKKIMMGGIDDGVKYPDLDQDPMSVVRGKDLKNLLTHSKKMLITADVFYDIWVKFEAALSLPTPVTIDFSEFQHTYPADILKDFERIVKKYRFLKGKFVSAYYTSGHKRNSDGVVEIAMYEYLIKLLFKTYGDSNVGSLGGYAMDDKRVLAVVEKIENELIDLGILLPQRASSIAQTVSLLGTLFQYQSDKNGKLDVNEATEFGLSLITSLDMASNMTAYFHTKECGKPKPEDGPLPEGSENDPFGRFSPGCFKKHFLAGVCEQYQVYYPLLFESLGAKTCDQLINTPANLAYLEVSIKAARTCHNYKDANNKPTDEIYYSEGDMFSILVAMMHIEATILRWDNPNGVKPGNNNNVMDAFEVNNAYEIYSPAIDGFLDGKPAIIKMFKKQIYQYLIKYEEIPDEKDFSSIWRFIKFLVSFDKKAPATRKTIASILYNISLQNAKMAEETGKPQFDCNFLKDPNNIPRKPQQSTVRPLTEAKTDYSALLEVVKPANPNDEDTEFYVERRYCITVFQRQYCL